MSQKVKIGLVVGVVILIFVVIVFLYQQKNQVEKENGSAEQNIETTAILNPINGQVVGEKITETNPFKAPVSPYEVYKNPFK